MRRKINTLNVAVDRKSKGYNSYSMKNNAFFFFPFACEHVYLITCLLQLFYKGLKIPLCSTINGESFLNERKLHPEPFFRIYVINLWISSKHPPRAGILTKLQVPDVFLYWFSKLYFFGLSEDYSTGIDSWKNYNMIVFSPVSASLQFLAKVVQMGRRWGVSRVSMPFCLLPILFIHAQMNFKLDGYSFFYETQFVCYKL